MKIGLLICTFNRPSYLKECLDSIRRTRMPENVEIMLVDDASDDVETKRLFREFYIDNAIIVKCPKDKNQSIKHSLIIGIDRLFKDGCDVVTNLDSDAVISNNFFEILLSLKERFPQHIITGFNCLTRNNDGSERHKVLLEGDGFNLKKSVGGLNMLFDEQQYNKWIRPALEKSLIQNLNWDDHTCRSSMRDGKEIVCAVPSVCNHIGLVSSMGHAATEKPDQADDFVMDFKEVWSSPNFPVEEMPDMKWSKLNLSNVTLIGADGFDVNRLIHAADISCRDIQFGAVKILSHLPSNDPRVIKIRPLLSSKEYSQFILKDIVNYVDTDYLLIFQHDGFIINPDSWSSEFLEYDMVGASWKFRPEKRTANGGFSLRSKRMCKAIQKDQNIYLQNDKIITNWAEDHVLFYIYREYLESVHNVKIAPEEVCDRFSFEGWGEKPPNNRYNGSFGFHGMSIQFEETDLPYIPYKLPNRKIL